MITVSTFEKLILGIQASSLCPSFVRRSLLRLCGAQIDPTAWIGHGVHIASARGLKLGRKSIVASGCYLDSIGGITIEDEAGCGPRCLLITGSHEVEPAVVRVDKARSIHAPIVIRVGTWVQAGVTICPGTVLGPGSIVLVGSTVTKDVKPNCMYGGSPARRVQDLPLTEVEMVGVVAPAF